MNAKITSEIEQLSDESPWGDVLRAFWRVCVYDGLRFGALNVIAVGMHVCTSYANEAAEAFENWVATRRKREH
jgi:hypothetical protein